jgi:opacity protein-like surface antigen
MKKISMLILILICFTQCHSSTETKTSRDKKKEQNISKENDFDESVSETNTTTNDNKVQIKEDTKIYDIDSIDVKPDFEGGIVKLQKFIRFNYKYPEEEGLTGKVDVNFVVEKNGSLSDIKVTRDIGFGTGDEAIRVLKKCPKWFPATHNNKLVRVRYYLTIPIDVYYEQTP